MYCKTVVNTDVDWMSSGRIQQRYCSPCTTYYTSLLVLCSNSGGFCVFWHK